MLKEVLLCVLIGYTLGNLNPAYVLAKRKGYDARVDGSGSAGASNAFILAGKTAFFIALPGGILLEHPLSAGFLNLLIPAVPVILRHAENFRRIGAGTEARFTYLRDRVSELERLGRSD